MGKMGYRNYYGEAVFGTVAARDRAAAALEDYIEATLNAEPYENQYGYAAGCQLLNNYHIGDSTGAGLRYSFRVDETQQAWTDLIGSAVSNTSLEGTFSSTPVD